MAQPYVGEIRMFAGNFAPAGWMFCEGQLLPISENETLFQLIGTTYGGDGESTFALPDLRGRLPIHQGNGFILAETGGVEEITLTVNQIAAHAPPAARRAPGSPTSPRRQATCPRSRRPPTSTSRTRPRRRSRRRRSRRSAAASPTTNFQPYLCVDFIISLFGIFPPRPRTRTHGRSLRRRDPHLPVQLRAQGLGLLRRPAAAALAEHRAVLAAGHDLRRERQVELRAARPPGQGADAPGPGPRAQPARPGREPAARRP